MITIVVGNLGSGKTLMLAMIGIEGLDQKKKVYSTFHLTYQSSTKNKASFVDVTDLLRWFQDQDEEFTPDSALLLIDEGYLGLDSRTFASTANRLLGNFAFQSRKLGLDLYISAQLSSSIDKRVRNLADAYILARKSEYTNEEGNTQFLFEYTRYDSEGNMASVEFLESELTHFFSYYRTMEIVEPPLMSFDKKTVQTLREQRASSSIKRKAKHRSELPSRNSL